MKRISTLNGKRIGGLIATFTLALSGAFAGTALANHNASDVPTGSFFHDEIGWLIENNIANGFPDGTFRPTENVKRQQVALWMANLATSFQLVSVDSTSGTGDDLVGVATCPAGTRAVAGGGRMDIDDVWMSDSFPSAANKWSVTWEREGDVPFPSNTPLTTWALCVPFPPAAG